MKSASWEPKSDPNCLNSEERERECVYIYIVTVENHGRHEHVYCSREYETNTLLGG